MRLHTPTGKGSVPGSSHPATAGAVAASACRPPPAPQGQADGGANPGTSMVSVYRTTACRADLAWPDGSQRGAFTENAGVREDSSSQKAEGQGHQPGTSNQATEATYGITFPGLPVILWTDAWEARVGCLHQ